VVSQRLVTKMLISLLAQGAVLFSLCAWTSDSRTALPSDAKLIREFRHHRGDFERLRQMATEDMHQQGSFTRETISNTFPESRRNEYRSLLSMVPNLSVGINYDGTTRFVFASSEGLAVGPGRAKGIQFSPTGTRLIGIRMSSLDELAKLPAGVYLREIEPQWFIFYQLDD
jgi:hypothetical protein